MYYRQGNQLSGLAIAPIIASAAGSVVGKILNLFGGGAAAAARRELADAYWIMLRALRDYAADPSTPGFIKPKARLLDQLSTAKITKAGHRISQWDLDQLQNVINGEIGNDLKRGVSTVYARFNVSGRDEVHRREDYPAVVAPVVAPAVAPAVVPVAPAVAPAVVQPVQPATYAPTLPAPYTAGAGLPGADMFGQKIFGIPMPLALGAAAAVMYMVTKGK